MRKINQPLLLTKANNMITSRFDMDLFQKGRFALTRNGRRVRFMNRLDNKTPAPILAVVENGRFSEHDFLFAKDHLANTVDGSIQNYFDDGKILGVHEHDLDLVSLLGI